MLCGWPPGRGVKTADARKKAVAVRTLQRLLVCGCLGWWVLWGQVSGSVASAQSEVLDEAAKRLRELWGRFDLTYPQQELRKHAVRLGGRVCVQQAQAISKRHARGQRPLDPITQHYLRPWFGDLVDRVRVVWHADLRDGIEVAGRVLLQNSRARTHGYAIYIDRREGAPDPGDTRQTLLLAHEFFHVQQYVRFDESLPRFCQQYISGWLKGGFVYEHNVLEIEAFEWTFAFAEWLATHYGHLSTGAQLLYYHEGQRQQGPRLVLPKRLPTALDVSPGKR